MLTLEVARDTLFVCMDKSRRVTLSKPLSDLEQFGIGAGTLITTIDGEPAMDYIAAAVERGEDIVTCEPRAWEFLLGERIVQIALFAKESHAELIRVRLADSETTAAIVVDIDKRARTVVVGEALGNLTVPVGAVCTCIDDTPPYAFLEGGLPSGQVLPWDFVVGEKTVRLALIFTDESEQAPAREAAEAPASEGEASFLNFRCEDWDSPDFSYPRPVPEPWHKPVFANLPEIPITDRQYHERPPRKMAVEWAPSDLRCNPDYAYHHYDPEQDIHTKKRVIVNG
jgi:hypothetical protein